MLESISELQMPRVIFGNGAFKEVGNQAVKLGKNVLIISDSVMKTHGNVVKCEEILSEKGITFHSYIKVDTEPTDIYVKEALEICYRENCDFIIAIGGGSCIDTAKAVAALKYNDGELADYFSGEKQLERESVPLIAIPTTAGTGSEVTKVTVITDTNQNIKMMFSDLKFLPTTAIVDPVLSYSCPKGLTAATGIDALCHAIEAYISKKSNPTTDMYAVKAIELIMNNLRKAFNNPQDVTARYKMALGSMYAGVAFSNSSVTLIHGMSRPIGVLFNVPHGISNAMLCTTILEYTKDSAIERLANIGRVLLPMEKNKSSLELANYVISEVKQLCQDLEIPSMQKYGINENDFRKNLSKMSQDAIGSGSPANNPKVPMEEEIVELYKKCFFEKIKETN